MRQLILGGVHMNIFFNEFFYLWHMRLLFNDLIFFLNRLWKGNKWFFSHKNIKQILTQVVCIFEWEIRFSSLRIFSNSVIVWKANIVILFKQRHRIPKNYVATCLGPGPEVFWESNNWQKYGPLLGSEQIGKNIF